MKSRYTESQSQCATVSFIKKQLPYYENRIILINNNAESGKKGAILKKLGLHAGVSDFLILMPTHPSKVMFVEMKVNTSLSNAQKEFRQMCLDDGYLFCKCQTADERKHIFEILKKAIPNGSD